MASESTEWILYGATGYTGVLAAELAAARGHKPILAGRNAEKVRPLAERLGLAWRAFGLDAPAALDAGLRGARLVLHCAGPFSATSKPMLEACLRASAHYLDLTGELEVFEAAFARDGEARARGVAVIPGVGFDVVPTDCLAALLHRKLPSARELELAFAPAGNRGGLSSAGTLKSSLEAMPAGGRVRRAGILTRVSLAHATRTVPFADKQRLAMAIPWGDVLTAFRSTGIPDITVYMAAPRSLIALARASRFVAPLLARPSVLGFLQRQVERLVTGPSAEARARGRVELWGRVSDGARSLEATMTTPEGYTFTADASLAAVQRVLAGVAPGAQTPSQAFGPDFARGLQGVTVREPPA